MDYNIPRCRCPSKPGYPAAMNRFRVTVHSVTSNLRKSILNLLREWNLLTPESLSTHRNHHRNHNQNRKDRCPAFVPANKALRQYKHDCQNHCYNIRKQYFVSNQRYFLTILLYLQAYLTRIQRKPAEQS